MQLTKKEMDSLPQIIGAAYSLKEKAKTRDVDTWAFPNDLNELNTVCDFILKLAERLARK